MGINLAFYPDKGAIDTLRFAGDHVFWRVICEHTQEPDSVGIDDYDMRRPSADEWEKIIHAMRGEVNQDRWRDIRDHMLNNPDVSIYASW